MPDGYMKNAAAPIISHHHVFRAKPIGINYRSDCRHIMPIDCKDEWRNPDIFRCLELAYGRAGKDRTDLASIPVEDSVV